MLEETPAKKKISWGQLFLGIIVVLFILYGLGFIKSPNNEPKRDVQNAIVIVAQSEQEGVHAEYVKITEMYGERNKDWVLSLQSMFVQDGKQYDELQIKLASGEEKTLIFDISQFSGKFN